MSIPIVKPAKMKEYEFKQSKYEVAPKIPFSQIVVGPSGSGKTILLQSMILDLYRDCFSRIFIFSSSINVDSVWTPVKDYIEKTLKIDPKKKRFILMISTLPTLKKYWTFNIKSLNSRKTTISNNYSRC